MKASRRTTAAQARKPSTGGPGCPARPGSEEPAIAALIGSGTRSGPTRVRPAISASRSCRSKVSAAVRSAPGSHQESSSLKATYGVWAATTPRLRAAAPRLRASRRTRTPFARAASVVPSDEPLSTTTIDGRSGSACSRSSVPSSSARRLRVAITTVTGSTGDLLPSGSDRDNCPPIHRQTRACRRATAAWVPLTVMASAAGSPGRLRAARCGASPGRPCSPPTGPATAINYCTGVPLDAPAVTCSVTYQARQSPDSGTYASGPLHKTPDGARSSRSSTARMAVSTPQMVTNQEIAAAQTSAIRLAGSGRADRGTCT